MSSIFISHSSEDGEFAKELEARLGKQNYASIFLDFDPDKGIVAGQSWEQTLYRKIRACKAVIAVCTDAYLHSKWCFAEIALARMEGKPLFALKVKGLSETSILPSILAENQYISMLSDVEQGFTRLWRGLNEIDLLAVPGEWDPKKPPYLGLNAFQEKHAPIFFGRDDEAREAVEMLQRGTPNLIMVLGGSGSGKSSLVRAGILPRLRRDNERWLIIEPMRPGTNPFLELANAIVQSYTRYAPGSADRIGSAEQLALRLQAWANPAEAKALAPQNTAGIVSDDERVQRLMAQLSELKETPPDFAERSFLNFLDWSLEDLQRICDGPLALANSAMHRGPTVLADLALDLRQISNRKDARVLLVLDQFEELLDNEDNEELSQDFLRLVRASIEAKDSVLTVLGTMRSDFLKQFQHNAILRGIDFDNLSLGPMKIDGMRKGIEEPAKLSAIELEKGLTDRLLEDTGNSDALPLLSFTLWVLWRDCSEDKRIEIKEYDAIGGLHGAIAREADALLDEKNELPLSLAFVHMARISEEGGYARRPVNWEDNELVAVHSVLEKFIKQRLLMLREVGGKKILEVTHEALFRSWLPLNKWLNEHRSDLLLKQEISREAEAWMTQGKPKDRLWRGTRLSNAELLRRRGKLSGDDSAFVRTAARKQRNRYLGLAASLLVVFVSMASLTAFAVFAERKAVASEQAIAREYSQMSYLISNMVENLLPEGSQPGKLEVNSDLVPTEYDKDISPLLTRSLYGNGRVVAVAHEGALSAVDESGQIFLYTSIKWATQNPLVRNRREILYAVGHCETVSVSPWPGNSLPFNAFKEWEYQATAVPDLTMINQNKSAAVLIIGNAWAAFTAEEISAVESFVASGGGLILGGLKWSWDSYRHSGYDACSINGTSSNRKIETDEYPMNTLGQVFGLQWVI